MSELSKLITADTDQVQRVGTSYGIIVRDVSPANKSAIVYDAFGDARNRNLFSRYQIQWFLKKGQEIPEIGIRETFGREIGVNDSGQIWETAIVASDLSGDQLPTSIKNTDTKVICLIESTIDSENVRRFFQNRYQSLHHSSGTILRTDKVVSGVFELRAIFSDGNLKLSITPRAGDPMGVKTRVIWTSLSDIDDGASIASIPAPMYSLMRPESFASSTFAKFARNTSGQDSDKAASYGTLSSKGSP